MPNNSLCAHPPPSVFQLMRISEASPVSARWTCAQRSTHLITPPYTLTAHCHTNPLRVLIMQRMLACFSALFPKDRPELKMLPNAHTLTLSPPGIVLLIRHRIQQTYHYNTHLELDYVLARQVGSEAKDDQASNRMVRHLY